MASIETVIAELNNIKEETRANSINPSRLCNPLIGMAEEIIDNKQRCSSITTRLLQVIEDTTFEGDERLIEMSPVKTMSNTYFKPDGEVITADWATAYNIKFFDFGITNPYNKLHVTGMVARSEAAVVGTCNSLNPERVDVLSTNEHQDDDYLYNGSRYLVILSRSGFTLDVLHPSNSVPCNVKVKEIENELREEIKDTQSTLYDNGNVDITTSVTKDAIIGYITPGYKIGPAVKYIVTQPFLVKKGQTIKFVCYNTNPDEVLIARTTARTIALGDSVESVETDGNTFTASDDTYIVISGKKGEILIEALGDNVPVIPFLRTDVESMKNDISNIGKNIETLNDSLVGQEQNYVEGRAFGPYGHEISDPRFGKSDFIVYEHGKDVNWVHNFNSSEGTISMIFLDENKNFIDYWSNHSNPISRTITSSEIERYCPNAKYLSASFVLGTRASVSIGNEVVWTPKEYKPSITDLLNDGAKEYADKANVVNMRDYKNKRVCFAHFSDIHLDSTTLTKIVGSVARKESIISDVVFTGDAGYSFGDDYSWILRNDNAKKYLYVIGNHDVSEMFNGFPPYAYAGTQAYNKFIKPNVSLWNVRNQEGKCYYYKDYNEKVRLIVLDGTKYDDEQDTWLSSTLYSAMINKLHVVIACHFHLGTIKKTYGTFDCFGADLVYNARDMVDVRVKEKIISFLNEGGDFVCWINGHEHRNYLGTLTEDNRILCITVGASGISSASQYTDMIQTDENDFIVNLISIDTDNHLLYLNRIGAKEDLYGRVHESLVWDYIKSKQLR